MKTDRRKFIRISTTVAAGAGCALLLGGSDFLFAGAYPDDTKRLFAKCGTCSQTLFCILNRDFGYPDNIAERASDPLAGGFMSTQNQCGMVWGASLATGLEAFRKFQDQDQAISGAVSSSMHIVQSFNDRANSVNCRDILGIDFTDKLQLSKFMLKSLPGGFRYMICMNLAEKWAPEAIRSSREGLRDNQTHTSNPPLSCASELAKKAGADEQEIVAVAGLAGGIGLSGNACGALGTAVYLSSLAWCKKNPGKSGYSNPNSNEILSTFKKQTGDELSCQKICGKKFATIEDHTEYVKNGGCDQVINLLSNSLSADLA